MFETKVLSNINQGMFADDEEIKESCKKVDYEKGIGNASGITVYTDGNKAYVHDDDGFYLVAGDTGSKKTRDVVAPYIYNNAIAGNSMIITDVKGDLYKTLSRTLRNLGYKIRVLNFNNPNMGDSYNPMLTLCRKYKQGDKDSANREVSNIGNMIFNCMKDEKDPFWTLVSADYFSGLMMTLFEWFDEKQATIANALNLHIQGEKKISGDTCMKSFFSDKQDLEVWKLLSATCNAPNDTRASIISVFTSSLNRIIGQNRALINMMSESSFEVDELNNEKTVLFIIANEVSLSVHSELITVILHQLYDCLVELSEENDGSLKRNVVFVLDEFGNLPPILDFQTKISLSRARRIFWMIVVQSFSQLELRYGKEVSRTIIGNTSNWIYLHSPDPNLLKYISDLTGEVSDNETGRTRNLLSVNQLRHFQKSNEGRTECLMLLGRMNPFVTYLPDISMYFGIEPMEKLDIKTRKINEAKGIDFCSMAEAERKKRQNQLFEKTHHENENELKEEVKNNSEKNMYTDPLDLEYVVNQAISELKGD